jgi:hypothetical protein
MSIGMQKVGMSPIAKFGLLRKQLLKQLAIEAGLGAGGGLAYGSVYGHLNNKLTPDLSEEEQNIALQKEILKNTAAGGASTLAIGSLSRLVR